MNKIQKDKQENELIFLGAIISTNDPISILTNIDIEYFTDNKIIDAINLCIDENKILPVSDKLFTRAKIIYEKFIVGKTQAEINESLKKIKNELYLNTEEGKRHNCVFTDLFDERLAVEVDEQYIDTGIEEFNYYLNGGLQKKTLVGIQAATGKGKTTMLMTLGCNMLKKGYNVAFVNLEMNEIEFNNNIISGISDNYSYSDIKMFNNLKHPDFRENLRKEILSKNIGRHIMLVNNEYESLTSETLESLLLKTEEDLNIKFDVILIDYLFLLKTFGKGSSKNLQQYEILQKVTQDAHKMSQRNNWAVLSVFQENRMGAKNTKTTGFEGMSGSFNALHDMDNYFKFCQVKVGENNFVVEVKPQKLRQFGAFDEDNDYFNMEYNPQKKIYQSVNKVVRTAFNWKEVYDLPEVHEQLCAKDIYELMLSMNIDDVPKSYDKAFSNRKKENNYKTPHGKSLKDWKSINVGSLITMKHSPKFFHNTTDLLNDDPQKLFEM